MTRSTPESSGTPELPPGRHHRDVLDAVRDVVLVIDSAGGIVDANRAADDAYGYERVELLSLNVRDLRASHAADSLDREFDTATEAGITFETVHLRKDGSTFPVEVSASPVRLDGAIGVISVIRDISVRKRAEDARARLLGDLSEANARLDGALTLLSGAVGVADLSHILENTVSALAQVMGADAALFIVGRGDSMVVSARVGGPSEFPVGTILKQGEGLCWLVAEANAPLYVADITSSSAALSAHVSAGFRAMFGVPVYVEGELFGVVECAWVTERPVDDTESAMIKVAAERIALAIAAARQLERSREGQRLSAALNEASTWLNASFELDEVLDRVLEIGCQALRCDTALLGRAAPGEWRVEHACGVELPSDGLAFDPLVLGVMSRDAPVVLVSGGSAHEAWLASRLGLTEAIVVPVPAHRGVGGALLFGRSAPPLGFDELSIDFAGRFAQSLALSLANAARFEAEHHIAETLQEALLLMPPSVSGVDFAHLYRSATVTTRVGGDFFDVFDMADGRTGVLVGDVSGKGLSAAVLTSLIKDTIRAYAHEMTSPAVAIARANAVLESAAKLPDFASLFYGVLDAESATLTYCNAGHPPPAVVARDGAVRFLAGASPVIGAFPDLTYSDVTVTLSPEDIVLLYTDGVTEARDVHGAFFGEEGLVETLRGAADAEVAQVPAMVFASVERFSDGRLTDDIALLAFRPRGWAVRVR